MDSLEKLHADWNRINNSDITIEMLEQIVYKRGLDNVRHTLTHKEVKEDIRHNLDAFCALSNDERVSNLLSLPYVYGTNRPKPQFFDLCKDILLSTNQEPLQFKLLFELIKPTLLPF